MDTAHKNIFPPGLIGFNRESQLQWVSSNRLTVLAGETPAAAPRVMKAYPTDHSDDEQYIREGEGFVIDGANFGGAEVAFQTRSDGGAWSEAGILDVDSEYTVNESGTSIAIDRQTVNGIIEDAELGDNDQVKFTISNDDGSASVERTVMLA